MKICPKCNLEYDDEYMFCHHCGSELQIKNEQRYCSYCGQSIDNDSDFCPFCGKSLSQKQSVNHSETSSTKITQSKQNSGDDYETNALGWFVIVLVYLFDLIAGLWAYHVSRLFRLQNIVSPGRLKEIGFPVSGGQLILTLVVVYVLLYISWYFVKNINAKAGKYLVSVVVACITAPIIGCLFGFVVSGILFWAYVAWCFYKYKNKH